VIINHGRLVTIAPLEELTSGRAGAVRVRAPRADRLAAVLAVAGIEAEVLENNELVVHGVPSARVGEIAFGAGIVVHELFPESSSLEDVFLQLTAKGA
jgi:ABC-2 type transport system ATP-binding protein